MELPDDLSRLVELAQELPAAKRAEVIDIVERLREREDDRDATEAELDAIEANPEAAARFRAAIQVGIDQLDRGEGLDGREVFARLLSGLPE